METWARQYSNVFNAHNVEFEFIEKLFYFNDLIIHLINQKLTLTYKVVEEVKNIIGIVDKNTNG